MSNSLANAMGKGAKKNLLAFAGAAATVLGISFLVPAYVKESYGLAGFAAGIAVLGLVILAHAFGE